MAKSVPVRSLIPIFRQMHQEHWAYDWSGHQQGLVGCAGAFVYAFDQLGINYPNGSNAIARGYIIGGMRPVSEAKPGMIAFKKREPGHPKYRLPDKYKPGGSAYNGDLRDYYHVGLVDVDTSYVLNAKGTDYGFCRDSIRDGWDFVARLTHVNYGEEEEHEKMVNATVVLPTGAKGNSVNLRRTAGKTSTNVIMQVPVGATVEVVNDYGEWCDIRYNGTSGYMMSDYLEYGQTGESSDLTDEQRQAIDNALKQIENATEIIGSIIGRG